MLIVAGFQVPCTPLLDVVGSAGAVLFWQSGPIWVNVGFICADTVMFIVAVAAHWPVDGVNVYVVVPVTDVLIVAGFHVPAIPLLDVIGNIGAVLFWQSGSIWVNAGII